MALSPTARVRAAFAAAPRHRFLPADLVGHAQLDTPLPIGHGATNSQPSTVATMLELLDPQPGDLVLDVGAGSGWTTALLAHLVGDDGHVIGVELVPELVQTALPRLTRHSNATMQVASPEVLGLPERAPFDRILVSAMPDELPQSLVDQLADGGRMVIPVDGLMLVVDRCGGEVEVHRAPGRYRFVPLL
ncbi:protein-L-isoaspartate O-methyltransferase family protein [Aestuariimicrobium ganziense]|uniref:protein-L-isoaspartate O-methyltransferase family protein n=1 Tax=Aestuariimicrobium ganziense TaxID=2773677 RepID=UPI001940A510|nr:methyltransferase domain-containing protein [Aestuariimicrobium ganziense]